MINELREDYEVEDFLTDESFTNYHFQLNTRDELSWKEWLANHPEKRVIVKQASELLQTLSLTISNKEYRVELEKIKSAISAKNPQPGFHLLNWNKNLSGRRTKRTLQYLLPILVIFILGGYMLLHTLRINTNQLTETANTQNQPLVITLSDSTVVTLTPHSVLHYPLYFQQDQRNVYLQGDAQFHVRRNEHAPFKVYSENIVATVLGTIFNFKKSGDSIVVELLKGKLNVELNDKKSSAKSMLLNPNEKAIYVKRDQAFYKATITPLTTKDFHFHQNNFNEIASRIKEVFGITVINKSDKKVWNFTGEFKDATAKDVIENICVVKGLSAEGKGDTIYIK